jgi:hypothetical protein
MPLKRLDIQNCIDVVLDQGDCSMRHVGTKDHGRADVPVATDIVMGILVVESVFEGQSHYGHNIN